MAQQLEQMFPASRIRSLAMRRGYKVIKSRSRPHCDNKGEYMLVQLDRNQCVLGDRYDASLEDIHEYLREAR
jgi:hypothetical protein